MTNHPIDRTFRRRQSEERKARQAERLGELLGTLLGATLLLAFWAAVAVLAVLLIIRLWP